MVAVLNETELANLTQNLTANLTTNVTLPPVPSVNVIHDSIFGGVWNFAVSGVQYLLNMVGIPATAEQAGWVVLGVMVFALYRNLTRVRSVGEDVFKVGIGAVIILVVLQYVLKIKIF
jgi:hypothetical protein